MATNDPQALLSDGLQQMDLQLSPGTLQKLLDYAQLLAKWSQVYNLTTIRAVHQIIPVHILDSLTLLKFVHKIQTVLDVGAGAGLPGLVLAITCPDINFTLLDSQQKKINFMQHVVTSLQLPNVNVVHARVESLQVARAFDMVVARAFASLDEFVKLIINVCDDKSVIVAMKAKRELVLQEAQNLPPNFELVNIETVTVPGIDAARCLVFLKKKG